MRSSRLARLVGAALLAAVLVPQAVMAAPTSSTTTTPPEIKLTCVLVNPNPLTAAWPNRADVCRWTAPTAITVAKYRVWRADGTAARVLIGTVASTDTLRFADRNIKTGHTYHYFVAGVNDAGTRVARSNVSNVYVTRAPQTLSFNCVLVTDNGTSWSRCYWSNTARATAVRYVLYRSVDGAARQAIYRTGIHGTRSYADKDVKSGQKIRYAVVAYDKLGHVVAYASPDTVQIP
jgi:fibronectin type 3 domain-containing protein